MCISGLVIALDQNDPSLDQTLALLAGDSCLVLGERQGRFLPASLEAKSGEASEIAHRRLEELPGIVKVDVVYVRFAGLGDSYEHG
jgi:nitrate reductase NapAB chaperone NapD